MLLSIQIVHVCVAHHLSKLPWPRGAGGGFIVTVHLWCCGPLYLGLATVYFLSCTGNICALLREGSGEPLSNLCIHLNSLEYPGRVATVMESLCQPLPGCLALQMGNRPQSYPATKTKGLERMYICLKYQMRGFGVNCNQGMYKDQGFHKRRG